MKRIILKIFVMLLVVQSLYYMSLSLIRNGTILNDRGLLIVAILLGSSGFVAGIVGPTIWWLKNTEK